jgi:hypothetical protein
MSVIDKILGSKHGGFPSDHNGHFRLSLAIKTSRINRPADKLSWSINNRQIGQLLVQLIVDFDGHPNNDINITTIGIIVKAKSLDL